MPLSDSPDSVVLSNPTPASEPGSDNGVVVPHAPCKNNTLAAIQNQRIRTHKLLPSIHESFGSELPLQYTTLILQQSIELYDLSGSAVFLWREMVAFHKNNRQQGATR